jgi:hypothetical protein
MTKILGIAGKKSSGKNTSINFLVGLHMAALGVIRGKFSLNQKGQLWISDLLGDKRFEGVFDIQRRNESMDRFKQDFLNPYLQVHSFADPLKAICIDVLGLNTEMCYGTNDDKDSTTHLRWENMPGIIDTSVELILRNCLDKEIHGTNSILNRVGRAHQPGPMTVREVMQYIGEFFRKMDENVWVNAAMRRIEKEETNLVLISDVRYPNEVQMIQQAGGKVLKLTRAPYKDTHSSETALDPQNFNQDKFDFILDNKDMSIPEQEESLYTLLHDIKWIPEILPREQ